MRGGVTADTDRQKWHVLDIEGKKGGGEPFPRHLQRIVMAASFRT
jgi:hypothetical protein